MKQIIADPVRCLACRTCEIACAMAHAPVEDLAEALAQGAARPRIYVESAGGLAVPLQCRHCEDAPCVQVCPSAALKRLGPDAPVLVEQEKCIGCEYCVQVCPFGVVRLTPERKAVIKCDLCEKRLAAGLQPACVAACPTKALVFEEVQEGARRRRAENALRLIGADS